MNSRWKYTTAYNDINQQLHNVKIFIEKDMNMLDGLTMRETTFLRWKIKEIEQMITHGADTEEEEDSEEEEEEEKDLIDLDDVQ
ncbi:MAG: hypothetical protein ACTSUE_09870 [Promethearchaeota archaeon]